MFQQTERKKQEAFRRLSFVRFLGVQEETKEFQVVGWYNNDLFTPLSKSWFLSFTTQLNPLI